MVSGDGSMELPTEYMLLDGYSLSTDDLLQLGKNRYKIKVTTYKKYLLLEFKN